MRRKALLHIAGIVILTAAAATPVGAAECAQCHPAQFAAHAQSNHAQALRPVSATQFAAALPDSAIGEARGGFLLTYTRGREGIGVVAERGGQRAQAIIEWAFGAGDQGVTPLAQMPDGTWLEHRISYYAKPGRFDLTLGHQPGTSASARAALGIPQDEATVRACFGCHATLGPTGVTVLQPGVACERCHEGTAAHSANPAAAKPLRTQVETCAACHRLTPPGGKPNDPLNIRFQPLGLVQSKCYLVGQVTCALCHPPHQNARRTDAAFYEARCQACHTDAHRPDGCLTCHMPKSSPAPYLTFTDHHIRIAARK